MISHKIDPNHVEDRFSHITKDVFGITTFVFCLCLLAELMVVLIFFTDDSKLSKEPNWQSGMKKAIFCLTIVNLMIALVLISMEDFKFVIQFFKNARESKTLKSGCCLVFLLCWVILGTVGLSFWLF